jgi:hypothetical protein
MTQGSDHPPVLEPHMVLKISGDLRIRSFRRVLRSLMALMTLLFKIRILVVGLLQFTVVNAWLLGTGPSHVEPYICCNFGHKVHWCHTKTKPQFLWAPKVT